MSEPRVIYLDDDGMVDEEYDLDDDDWWNDYGLEDEELDSD